MASVTPDSATAPALARRHLVALLVLLPSLAGALAIAIAEGTAHGSVWCCGGTPAMSFADALRNSDLDSAAIHLRTTSDPNTPIPFRDPALTGDRTVHLSPVMIAIAGGKEDSVMTLLGAGATLTPQDAAAAKCLAAELGYISIAALLERYGPLSDPHATCPDAGPGSGAPLLRFAAPPP